MVLLCAAVVLCGGCRRKANVQAEVQTEPEPELVSTPADSEEPRPPRLLEARAGYKTVLLSMRHENKAAPKPPEKELRLVKYRSPVGELVAYVTPPPKDGKRRPAVIWIVGGLDSSIGKSAWEPAPEENDQSARAFRQAGLVLMLPSLRGGNKNPGVHEGFYGEVDDVLAAADYVQSLDYVDKSRIYLGGHCSGGTLAVLVAAATDRFRAVFALEPVFTLYEYGQRVLPFYMDDVRERELRTPFYHMKAITTPTLMFEGANPPSSTHSVTTLEFFGPIDGVAKGYVIPEADNVSLIAPVTRLLAEKIKADTGEGPITLSDEEVKTLMQKWGRKDKESGDEEE